MVMTVELARLGMTNLVSLFRGQLQQNLILQIIGREHNSNLDFERFLLIVEHDMSGYWDNVF